MRGLVLETLVSLRLRDHVSFDRPAMLSHEKAAEEISGYLYRVTIEKCMGYLFHHHLISYTYTMLYTRKGDNGTTKDFNSKPGERKSKSSCQTEALGALDELNSFLGLVKVKSANVTWKVKGKS